MATQMEQMLLSQIEELRELLQQTREHGLRTQQALDGLRQETQGCLTQQSQRIEHVANMNNSVKHNEMQFVQPKHLYPTQFANGKNHPWRQYARQVKIYVDAFTPGMQKLLEWADMETEPIKIDDMDSLSTDIDTAMADSRLYSLLLATNEEEALVLVENHAR